VSTVSPSPLHYRASGPVHDNAGSWIPPWRAVSAKFMELRRRRGLIVAVLLLTIGILVVIDAIFVILHATDPSSYGPAGGLRKFRAFVFALIDLFGITGAMVGAAAGSSDLSSGVFRHLVVTGRSRLSIFLSWIPAGLMVILPIAAVTYAIEALVAVFFAPSGNIPSISVTSGAQPGTATFHYGIGTISATPDTHLLVITGLWLMLQVVVAYILGLGLGALTGSRSVTIVILIAMQLVVTPIMSMVSIPHLLNLQRAFVGVAIAQLEPSQLSFISGGGGGGGGGGGNGGSLLGIPAMPTFGLVIVLVAWVVVFLAVGARRTVRRDA
jgi:ABC-type transport system involved in multi-copper enzyme maturation permease subunit